MAQIIAYKSTASTDPWTYFVDADGNPVAATNAAGETKQVVPGSGPDRAIRAQIESGTLNPMPGQDLSDADMEIDPALLADPLKGRKSGPMPNMDSAGGETAADRATAGATEKAISEARGYAPKRNSIIDRVMGTARGVGKMMKGGISGEGYSVDEDLKPLDDAGVLDAVEDAGLAVRDGVDRVKGLFDTEEEIIPTPLKQAQAERMAGEMKDKADRATAGQHRRVMADKRARTGGR